MTTTSLKVHVHAADDGGCGHYRMIWPGRAVDAVGLHEVTVSSPTINLDASTLKMDVVDSVERIEVDGGIKEIVRQNVVGLAEKPDSDVVVLQRPLERTLADCIPHLQRAGVAVVVELDDDFQALIPSHSAFKSTNPRLSPDRNWQHLQRACSMADLVTVSTPALARKYARHGRVRVLPNYLPPMWADLQPERDPDHLYLGWSGTVPSHPTDLKQMGTVVSRLVEEHPDLEVVVVGTGIGVAAELGLPEIKASGWAPIDLYPSAIANLDIGIVPLDLIPFNHAKSWLKGLEFAAAGVPFVASPTEPYVELRRLGVGSLAHNQGHWYKKLSALVESPDMRATVAGRNREVVLRDFMLVDHLDLWADAWTIAADYAVQRQSKEAMKTVFARSLRPVSA